VRGIKKIGNLTSKADQDEEGEKERKKERGRAGANLLSGTKYVKGAS
jgi:hypothetical protein